MRHFYTVLAVSILISSPVAAHEALLTHHHEHKIILAHAGDHKPHTHQKKHTDTTEEAVVSKREQ